MKKNECPLCKTINVITIQKNYSNEILYDCSNCGNFSIKGWRLKNFNFQRFPQLIRLKFAIHELSSKSNRIVLSSYKDIYKIIKLSNLLELYKEKLILLVKYLSKFNNIDQRFILTEKMQ